MNAVVFIERFVGILLIVVGISHIVAAKLWASFFSEFLPKPWAGLVIGVFTLPLGLAIVLLHNVWVAHFAVITTLLGWAWTIKGALYLLVPATPTRVSRGMLTAPKFVFAGVVCLALGTAITYGAFRNASLP